MFAQSTPISYHTEAFVKTEVFCTVQWHIAPLWKGLKYTEHVKAKDCLGIFGSFMAPHSTPSLLHNLKNGRFGLLLIVSSNLYLLMRCFFMVYRSKISYKVSSVHQEKILFGYQKPWITACQTSDQWSEKTWRGEFFINSIYISWITSILIVSYSYNFPSASIGWTWMDKDQV